MVWQQQQRVVKHREDGSEVVRTRHELAVVHEDLIGEPFWVRHPHLLQ